MPVKIYQIQSWDLVKKFELTVPGIEDVVLKIHDVSELFKNARRTYNIKGKFFIFIVNAQVFMVVKQKDDFKIYDLN